MMTSTCLRLREAPAAAAAAAIAPAPGRRFPAVLAFLGRVVDLALLGLEALGLALVLPILLVRLPGGGGGGGGHGGGRRDWRAGGGARASDAAGQSLPRRTELSAARASAAPRAQEPGG